MINNLKAFFLLLIISFQVNAKIEILDRVAIIVEEGVVLESQVISMLETVKKRYSEQGAALPPEEILLEQVHERLIIEELQLQMGRRAGVRIGDGELNQTFENIAQSNGLSLEEFIKALEAEGESYEELRSQVRKEMIIQRVQRGKVGREVQITEQELDGFLATEGAIKELSPELFVLQILVEDEIQANSIIEKINNGADFRNLAKDYSKGNNASSGGEMGWRNLVDMPTLFAEALKNKKKGYISDPLKGGSGFFILKLEDKRGDLVRFEEQWNVRHILMMTTKLRDKNGKWYFKKEPTVTKDNCVAVFHGQPNPMECADRFVVENWK